MLRRWSRPVNAIGAGCKHRRACPMEAVPTHHMLPAHIHPGSCEDLVPQPKYPLQNVVNGSSTTVVPAGLAELMAGDLAVNLHRSNDDLGTYTACADLG